MTAIQYVFGHAAAPEGQDRRIICHVCSDGGRWGQAFAQALSRRWPGPEASYRAWYRDRARNDFALGSVQVVPVERDLWVANMIGQHTPGSPTADSQDTMPAIRYDAIEACLAGVAQMALDQGASVHMPRIGPGVAEANWQILEPIIHRTLCSRDIPVFVYDLRLPQPGA